mmetsp:Transcript_41073/g.98355  ORF Transcript_41073/g.98355 Transcript_41073/m.98355 type:complete len:537 (+) Transcript_41073:106-1716(+)
MPKQSQRFSFYQPTTSDREDSSSSNSNSNSNSSNMGKDDGDLDDLLTEVRNDIGGGIELAPLTGGSGGGSAGLAKGGASSSGATSSSSSYGNFTLFELLFAYVTYTCEYAPKVCWTIGIILLVVPAYLLVMGVLANPTEHFGEIKHDYSTIQSIYDFKIKDIDHWCLKGDDSSCRCEDPLQPAPRSEFRAWGKAHGGNVDMITKLEEADMMSPDIAFLGGSIVEQMDGKWFGDQSGPNLRDIAKSWSKHFTSIDSTAATPDAPTAVAMGIIGDTSPSVLWRILNGEMPDDFNPKLWWLELGLNDLGRQQCSEEVVVMGILRVVEEILNKKPDAKIVINSLFPMADLRTALNPNLQDVSGTYKEPRIHSRHHGSKHRGDKPSSRSRPVSNEEKEGMIQRPPRTKFPPKPNGNDRQRQLRHRRKRKPRRERKPVKMNPEKKTIHKYNAITHKEKRKLPLWTSIMAINKQLRKFSFNHERVFFFDATSIFTEREGRYFTLKTDLINVLGIPTNVGYDQWERAVVVRAQQLLKEDEDGED